MPDPELQLVEVHTRLFAADIEEIKRIAAAKGVRWQIELRTLIRRTLKGERHDVVVLQDQQRGDR